MAPNELSQNSCNQCTQHLPYHILPCTISSGCSITWKPVTLLHANTTHCLIIMQKHCASSPLPATTPGWVLQGDHKVTEAEPRHKTPCLFDKWIIGPLWLCQHHNSIEIGRGSLFVFHVSFTQWQMIICMSYIFILWYGKSYPPP